MAENKIINPLTGNTLIQLKPISDEVSIYKSKSVQVIDTGLQLDPFISQLPLLASAEQLGQAYKVVFPPGVTGELVRHVQNPELKGLAMTTIRGADGKFSGQAGLQSLSALQAPLIIFVVMSAVTGQYFQAKIERTIRRVSQQIDQIIHILLAEKESEIRSIYHFTQYITDNFDVICSHNELRLSTLINIQRNNINLYSLLKFYEKNISFELDKMDHTGRAIKAARLFSKSEIEELKEEIGNVSNFLERRQACIDLYLMGRILEVQLGSIFNRSYLVNLQKIFREIDSNNLDLMNRIIDIHKDVFSIKSVKEEKSMSIGKLESELRALNKRKTSTSETIESLVSSVDALVSLDKKGFECLYHDNQLHLLEN